MAGTIASRNGKVILAPRPFRKVLRGKALLNININLLSSFGRGGVIQSVADIVFGRFVDCVQGKLGADT